MIPGIWLAVYILAVYRLSELLSNDLIFESVRQFFGKKAAAGSRVWKNLADWIHCPLCIGVWFSFPAAILFANFVLHAINILQILVLWLGIAGAQYFLSSLIVREEEN